MRRSVMHTLLLTATSLFLSGGVVAFAQPPGNPNQPQQQTPGMGNQQPGMNQPGSPGYNPGAVNEQSENSQTSQSSRKVNADKFLKKAAEGNMAEIQAGKIAAEKGTTQAIKDFGNKLVSDHTKAQDQLKQVAAKENVNLPDSLSGKHQKEVNKLSSLSGEKFDKAFIKSAVKDHHKDIREYQRVAQRASNPNVKQYAENQLPVLKEHLQMAQNLKTSTGRQKMGDENGMNGQNGAGAANENGTNGENGTNTMNNGSATQNQNGMHNHNGMNGQSNPGGMNGQNGH